MIDRKNKPIINETTGQMQSDGRLRVHSNPERFMAHRIEI
jgi:hypothetical protein